MLEINVKERSNDWIAELTKNPKIWEAGKNKEEAVYKLVISLQTYKKTKVNET